MKQLSVSALRVIIVALVLANLLQWWNPCLVVNIRGNAASSTDFTVTIDLDLLGNDSVRHRPHLLNLYSFIYNNVSSHGEDARDGCAGGFCVWVCWFWLIELRITNISREKLFKILKKSFRLNKQINLLQYHLESLKYTANFSDYFGRVRTPHAL